MKKIKEMFLSVSSKNGAYSVGTTAVVIAIAIVFNMIIGQLPEKIKTLDISDNKIYEITKTSKNILKDLDKNITLTVLAEKSSTDSRIKTFLNKYASLSDKVKVEWIDPVLHPATLTKYDAEKNTIIVSCEETAKTDRVLFTDIIQYDTSSYYSTGNLSESAFDAEGQLTSAVNNVTNDVSKKIYRTAGHGEATFGSNVTEQLEKSNLTMEELNFVMKPEVPEDCDLLMMNAPAKDISDDEEAALSGYLEKGGKVMILLGETSEALPKLTALLKEYGIQVEDGYVADTERGYQGNYYYIFPNLSSGSEQADGLTTNMVLVANTKGMTVVDPVRDTITAKSFMDSSSNAYVVTEDNQTKGTYSLGAVATETISADDSISDEARLTVFGTNTVIDSGLTSSSASLENMSLFVNAVTGNFDDVKNVSIEPKSLTISYNTMQHAGAFSMLVIFGIPLVILIAGFVVWNRRRRA